MSAPAENALVPAPRSTSARTPGSSAASASSAGSRANMANVTAFSTSGRLIVTTAAGPSRSSSSGPSLSAAGSAIVVPLGMRVIGDPGRGQGVDLGDAEFGQHRAGVLAQPGRRPRGPGPRPAELRWLAQGLHRAHDRVLHLDD